MIPVDSSARKAQARRLVPAMLLVGLAAGAIMLAAFGWAIFRTHTVQVETNELAKVMDDILDRTTRWDDRASTEILLLLEKRVSPATSIDWVETRQHPSGQAKRLGGPHE